MSSFEGPDCSLYVEMLGDDEPRTIFAHGITGSTDELTPFAAPMHGTRVLFDFRGHGSSDSPEESAGYDHPAMRRDVEAVADNFRVTRCVALSMGAGAVLNLLIDRPDRFDRVVLISPASIDGPNEPARGLFLEMARRLEEGSLDDVLAWSLEGSAEIIARSPQWRDLIRERVMRMNAVGIPRTLRAYVDGRPPVEDASLLARVTAPTLILACENDAIHDVAVANRLADLLPNSTLKVWPEPLAMFDDPDALSGLIEEFLDG